VAYVAFVASATCALAALTYRWVEVPCIRAGNLVSGGRARRTRGQRRDSTALPPPAA
jgi:peptidoglycan/LPS O-acetylase OafA/YrhL